MDYNLETRKQGTIKYKRLPRWTFFVVKPVLGGLQERPRAIPTLSFRLQEPSRALQEASKRLSDGFRVEDAMRIPFWIYFGLQKETLGLQKSRKSFILSMYFYGFPIFSSVRFGCKFWDPPGHLLGSHVAPRQLETSLLGALGPAKSRSQ